MRSFFSQRSAVGRILAGVAVFAARPAFAAGMPQLNAANPLLYWQLVWGAAIFLVLYLVLKGSALPRVASLLEVRRSRIESDLDAARDAKREADEAGRAVHEERKRANAEAQDVLARTIADARERAVASLREINAKLDAESEAAERRLSASRQQALASLPGVAVETAATLVEKLTGRTPDRARIESAVHSGLQGSPLAVQSA